MKPLALLAPFALLLAGCGRLGQENPPAAPPEAAAQAKPNTAEPVAAQKSAESLVEARRGFKTSLVRKESAKESLPAPPPNLFSVVKFDSPAGKLAGYLTPDPRNGKKNPAIIWITGGDCNTVGDVWSPAPASDDQTAAAYRKAGIIMMFPSLRGGNMNPGVREGFLGEVDDVIAAAEFLARQDYVDPARIYLGGHSTGGTLVLLVAECTDRFRAIFSFGPVDNVLGYGPEYCPFNRSDPREAAVRSPGKWLASIQSTTIVLEGASRGNVSELQAMSRKNTNPKVAFLPVQGATHFSTLAPLNRLLAERILRDDGPTCNIALTADEVAGAMASKGVQKKGK